MTCFFLNALIIPEILGNGIIPAASCATQIQLIKVNGDYFCGFFYQNGFLLENASCNLILMDVRARNRVTHELRTTIPAQINRIDNLADDVNGTQKDW